MKKLLLFAAICLLAGCGTQKGASVESKEPTYRSQTLNGQLSAQESFFLLNGEKELNEMKVLRSKNRFVRSFQKADLEFNTCIKQRSK